MNGPTEVTKTNDKESRDDAGNWAPMVQKLQASGMPAEAPNLVDGRRLVGPLQGFGKMWQKTYRVKLASASLLPAEVVKTWKVEFSQFWPAGNRFYTPLTGIEPGEVALVSLSAGPMKLSTGVMVLYADDESFTLMTPQGHMFAGWITFSAFREADVCVAQAQVLMRAQDPIGEMGLTFGGHKAENRFWSATLRALAERFDLPAEPEVQVNCVDPRRRWSQVGNVWHNAGIRSTIYMMSAPLRGIKRIFKRGGSKAGV